MHTAIYLRSSRRDPVALAQQQQLLEQICRQNGWKSEVYRDEGASELLEQRPGLARLLKQVEAGEVERVLVSSWDRLAKDQAVLADLKQKLEQAGVTIMDWYQNTL